MMTEPPEKPSGISCIVPVYNEAGAIEETLKGLVETLQGLGRPYELILVDDGSTDETARLAEAIGYNLTTLRHERNRGYGAAIKTGLRRASHPWVLITDADGTYPPEEIVNLVRALDEDPSVDMIVGARRQTRATDGFWRLQGKALLTRLACFLAGSPIPDLNSGLRLMRKTPLDRYRALLPDGFSLTTSITLALLCSGSFVRYVPIEYRPRTGQSKIRPLRDMGNFILLILRTITYFNPLKVYAPLCALFVAASALTVVLSKALPPHQVMDVTALYLFIAGMQFLLIGVLADLILKVTGMRGK